MWLISQGEVVEMPCPTSLNRDTESNLTTSTSATGYRRASYFGGAHYLRTWSLDHSELQRAEAALLEAFTLGGFGTANVGFIPTGAEHLNLFTPAQSLMAVPTSVNWRVTTRVGDTVYPSGVVAADWLLIASDTPFPFAGQTLNLSAVMSGTATLALRWLDSSGATISNSYVESNQAGYTRRSAVITAPTNATAFQARIIGDVAAPALTLGATLRPWAVGQTAKSVVVTAPKDSLLSAWDPASIITSKSYQVVEVGAYG